MSRSIKVDLSEELARRLDEAGIRPDEAARLAAAALGEAADRPELRAQWGLIAEQHGHNPASGLAVLSEEEIEQRRRQYVQTVPVAAAPDRQPAPASLMPPKRSIAATASFVLGLLGIAGWIAVLGLAAYGQMRIEPANRTTIHAIVGLSAVLGLMVNAGALIAGIVGCTQKAANTWMAIVGVILNGLQIAGMVGIIMLGMQRASSRPRSSHSPWDGIYQVAASRVDPYWGRN